MQVRTKLAATWDNVNSRSISFKADFEVVGMEKHFQRRENDANVNSRVVLLDDAREIHSVAFRNIDVTNGDAQ